MRLRGPQKPSLLLPTSRPLLGERSKSGLSVLPRKPGQNGLPVLKNRGVLSSALFYPYLIANSFRTIQGATNAWFYRTYSATGNAQKFSIHFFVKRGRLGLQYICGAQNTAGQTWESLQFNASDELVFDYDPGTAQYKYTSVGQVFRDPTAFYHIVVQIDTTQAVAADRTKIFVNNRQLTLTANGAGGSVPQNYSTRFNVSGNTFGLCVAPNYASPTGVNGNSGDMTIANFMIFDGLTVAPTETLEFISATNEWAPKRYAGSWGTNGAFYEFKDATSATNLGLDTSGNGWGLTPSAGVSVTAGSTFCQSLGTPTNNYATLNPLRTTGTLSDSNLRFQATASAGNQQPTSSTIYFDAAATTGVYWEVNNNSPNSGTGLGLVRDDVNFGSINGTGFNGVNGCISFNGSGGALNVNGSNVGTFTAYGLTDTVSFRVRAGSLWIAVNGTTLNSGSPVATGLTGNWTAAACAIATSNSIDCQFNFGQRPFTYAPPTGFLALNTQNLPTPAVPNPADAYLETIYAGNNGTQAIGNRFQAGSIRQKGITVGRSWRATNAVRGFDLVTNTDTTAIEAAGSSIASVSPTAINLQNADNYNTSAEAYLLQAWRLGALYGFDIRVYTGNGSTQEIAHGLGKKPDYIEVKNLTGSTGRWCVFHRGWGAARYGYLNENFAFDTASAVNRWGNNSATVEPTSNVFTVGNSADVNSNTNLYIAFIYTSVPGLSAFPDYIGNSSASGPWVDLGFKFRTMTIKDGSAVASHRQYSGMRQPFNGALQTLFPNAASLPQAENFIERYGSGFRAITGAGNGVNDSGNRYLVTAFAESSFKFATGV